MHRLCLLFVLLSFLTACETRPETPVPIAPMVPVPTLPATRPVVPQPPESIRRINDAILDTGKDLLDKGQETLLPDKPVSANELPRVNIHTEPRNLLNLTTATVPITILFEAAVLNEGATHPIAEYNWTITKLGLPFFGTDQLVQTANGKRFSFTFQEKAAYRVTLTVSTSQQEQASSSIILWGRG